MSDKNAYAQKLRHLGPGYLLALFLAVPGLALVRLGLNKFLSDLPINQDVWEHWIPGAISLLLVVVLLRHKIKILRFADKTDNRRFVLLVLAGFSLWLPSVLAQKYVLVATSDLHDVRHVHDINADKPHRYYRLSNYGDLRQYASSFAEVSLSGRSNDKMNFNFYFAIPLVFDEQSIGPEHKYWFGLKHFKSIDNRLSEEEKERLYKQGFEAGVAELNGYYFRDLSYFEVLSSSSARDNYRAAIAARYGDKAAAQAVILLPKTGAFDARAKIKLSWIFLSLAIGAALLSVFLAWPSLDSAELERQQRGQMPAASAAGGVAEFFIPRGRFVAAPIIIDAIIVVFLVLLFAGVNPINPSGGDLLDWGANRRSDTMSGQWWRLVSSMFLHGGILHLALNVYGLIVAALFVEPLFGRARFMLIYFVSGIAGSLASIWWYENTISIGASGAIFGLFGAIFALALKGVLDMKALFSMWVFVGISLLFGVTGGIDNAAHIGGLLAGVVMGLLLGVVIRLQRPD